jgi:pimeloyl-ACP methyl ester carboxylesterase
LVLVWAHGTVGLARRCAPSREATNASRVRPWLNAMLDQGWVVAAPDYAGAAGVGVRGGERYMIAAEQPRDVLNAVRAARSLGMTGAGDQVGIYGHSQGGLVAVAAAALAPDYAPELKLVGVGGVAAASDVASMMHESWADPLVGWALGPMFVSAWTRYYPNLDPDAILTEAGRNHFGEVALHSCVDELLPTLINSRMGPFFAVDPTTDAAWKALLLANRAPLLPAGLPAFVAHGLADTLIDPGFSAELVDRYCAAGTRVRADWLSGVGHFEADTSAAPAFVAWLANLTQGRPAPSDCDQPLPVGRPFVVS